MLSQRQQQQQQQPAHKVKITYSLEGAEKVALETFQREVQHFRDAMAPYGVVVDTFPGCVVINMKINSNDQLQKLKEDHRSGILYSVLRGWLVNNTRCSNQVQIQDDMDNFQVEISEERIIELEAFMSKGN